MGYFFFVIARANIHLFQERLLLESCLGLWKPLFGSHSSKALHCILRLNDQIPKQPLSKWVYIPVPGLVLCVGAWKSGVHIVVLHLLSSLNVEFYRDWRGQRPQFKFVYYLWPNLAKWTTCEEPNFSWQSIDVLTKMGILRSLRIFRNENEEMIVAVNAIYAIG